jgi:hypothetical protein
MHTSKEMNNSQLMDYMVSLHFIDFMSGGVLDNGPLYCITLWPDHTKQTKNQKANRLVMIRCYVVTLLHNLLEWAILKLAILELTILELAILELANRFNENYPASPNRAG